MERTYICCVSQLDRPRTQWRSGQAQLDRPHTQWRSGQAQLDRPRTQDRTKAVADKAHTRHAGKGLPRGDCATTQADTERSLGELARERKEDNICTQERRRKGQRKEVVEKKNAQATRQGTSNAGDRPRRMAGEESSLAKLARGDEGSARATLWRRRSAQVSRQRSRHDGKRVRQRGACKEDGRGGDHARGARNRRQRRSSPAGIVQGGWPGSAQNTRQRRRHAGKELTRGDRARRMAGEESSLAKLARGDEGGARATVWRRRSAHLSRQWSRHDGKVLPLGERARMMAGDETTGGELEPGDRGDRATLWRRRSAHEPRQRRRHSGKDLGLRELARRVAGEERSLGEEEGEDELGDEKLGELGEEEGEEELGDEKKGAEMGENGGTRFSRKQ